MGYYINPEKETKEEFLKREGIEVEKLSWDEVPEGHLPVVLCYNPLFTAAGIAFSLNELKAFTDPSDTRKKKYYYVEKTKLKDVSDLPERYY